MKKKRFTWGRESSSDGKDSMRPKHAEELTDGQIVGLVLAGRTEAFAVLVDRHKDALCALLSRYLPPSDVAEIAQDSFVQAFEKLGQLREAEAFRAWLSSIAVRRCLRHWRSVASRREVSLSGPGPDGPDGRNGQDWLEIFMAQACRERHEQHLRQAEAKALVAGLMEHLKAEDRMALGLFYAKEHPVGEIAAMLDWTAEKVKVRLHRARKSMAKMLNELVLRGE